MSDPRTTVAPAPAPTITFQIDGETVSADAAAWYVIAPCGCAEGATVVGLPGVEMKPKLTEEDAWAEFYEGRGEQRRRDQAAGFTMRLGHRSAVRELMRECEHDPKWGVPPTPKAEGHEWATTHRIPSARDRRHLVPEEAVTFDGGRLKRSNAKAVALCGRSDWYWFHDKPWVKDAPTCRRCEAKAREQVAA